MHEVLALEEGGRMLGSVAVGTKYKACSTQYLGAKVDTYLALRGDSAVL